MMKKIFPCLLTFLTVFWCGCENKPSGGEKEPVRSEKNGEKQAESSADTGKSGIWKNRLQAASAEAERARGDDKKHVEALNELASLYAEGLQNGWVHPLDVRSWCESVAESGAGYSGETVIGALFLDGTGVTRDPAAAREWFEYGLARPGSQRGNALYMLGMMYSKGDGVNQDQNKALELWHKAADENHPGALSLLGRASMEGKLGLDKDAASGLAFLERAANGGDVAASMYLGRIYAKGEGVAQDMERALKWYQQAASAGDPHAQYIVGLAYLDGSGVPVDEGKAFNWLRLAAGQEHVNAMLMLSVCYSTGKGTRQDANMAEVWKKKALELNSRRQTPQEGHQPSSAP